MKRLPFPVLLAVLAALAAVGSVLSGAYASLAAFPFAPLSALIRALSGSPAGDAAGWAILAAGALVPLVPVMRHGFDADHRAESAALCVVAAETAAAVYLMANPALLTNALPMGDASMLPVLHAVLGGTVWSGVVAWLILRVLRHFRQGGRERLLASLRVLLYALCVLFTAAAAVGCVEALRAGFAEASLPADRVMTILRAAASALPYVLDAAVTLSAIRLLGALTGLGDVTAALSSLTRRCTASLAIVTAVTALMNLLQLLLMGALSDVHATLTIPVVSLAFVLFTLLFARLIDENRALQGENDLFI